MVGNISGVAGKPVFFLQIKADADGEPIVLFAFRKSFGVKSCMSLRPASMYSKNDIFVALIADDIPLNDNFGQ